MWRTMRALLVVADIGGYTRFMRLHRMSLVHAQDNTARLLEATIDAAPRLELAGVEGDAAFLFVRQPEDEEIAGSIAAVAAAMHRAFHVEQERLASLTLCPCPACDQIGQLTVKAVAHLGEVAAVDPLPAPSRPALRDRVRHEAGKTLRSLPYYVGLKRSRVGVG